MNTRHSDHLPAGAVVVGYDQTTVAGYALDWAADHAAKQGRPLVVVHAAGSLGTAGTTWLDQADPATEPALVEMTQQGEALLARAIARVGERQPGVRVSALVAMDEAAPELLQLSRTAALVVTGSRGHGLLRSVPTGQVGTAVARHTSCPLVVVPDHDLGAPRRGVLAGVRIGEADDAVLGFAYEYAAAYDLPVTVAHATRNGDDADDLRRQMVETMSGYAEQYPDVWAHSVLLPGRPVKKLLELAERMDLLVVGQHQPTALHASPFGHVRSSIVDRASCPTAVVPVPVSQPA
jgi:nucleotide-binding universal stress UspA family protein